MWYLKLVTWNKYLIQRVQLPKGFWAALSSAWRAYLFKYINFVVSIINTIFNLFSVALVKCESFYVFRWRPILCFILMTIDRIWLLPGLCSRRRILNGKNAIIVSTCLLDGSLFFKVSVLVSRIVTALRCQIGRISVLTAMIIDWRAFVFFEKLGLQRPSSYALLC
jgi:hypothetical protein